MEFGRFGCGKLRNFANWPAEFHKILSGKLWALVIMLQCVFVYSSPIEDTFKSKSRFCLDLKIVMLLVAVHGKVWVKYFKSLYSMTFH